jgi:large subunit ribosomal protein L25
MPDIKLVAETGRPRGSAWSRRLRHEGHIPAVVYGHGIDATPITVEGRALRSALSTSAGLNVVLELDVDGKAHLAMAKDVQRHPVRGTVAHVDFLVVNRDERVTVDVPVVLVGEATEVNMAAGSVDHLLFNLAVHTTPANIPERLEADISGLTVGAAVRVSDLVLPPGVTTDVDPETVVASGQAAKSEAAMAAAEGVVETAPVEGEAEAAAAEGEGPAES